MNIRDARPEEAARLAEFGARTFREAFGADNREEDMRAHLGAMWSPGRQRAEIEDPAIDTLICVGDGDAWHGFARLRAGTTSEGVPPEGSIELWRFYVDRPWQGAGIASALMSAAKRRARDRGATSMWLGVWERNARAQAFYRKHGFTRVGSQVFTVGSDPQTDHVMWCPLS